MAAAQRPNNLLLRSLPPAVSQAVIDVAELVVLDLRENVIEPNIPIDSVDFPESGVMSMLTVMEDGSLVEIATIGKEGMVGVPVVLGVSCMSQLIFCQVEGSAWRIATTDFLRLLKEHPELLALCQRYAATLFDQIAHTTGCNRTHSIEERCARWLLLTHDRCGSDQFTLTQEFLAAMLGVSRTGVNLAAGALSKAKLITYVRGKLTVLNRKGLEGTSCDCYFAMSKYFDKVMNGKKRS